MLLKLTNIIKNYDGLDCAVSGINLDLASGTTFLVLGSIGSGKSTLCRIVAGLENPSSGEMFFDSVEYGMVSIKQRDVCYIGDSCTLWRGRLDKTIIKGAKRRALEKSEIKNRLQSAEKVLGIENWQKYRYSKRANLAHELILKAQLARAIVRQPKILIIDDMFLGYDIEFINGEKNEQQASLLLKALVDTIKHLQLAANTAIIITTSEQFEADFLAEQLAIEYKTLASGILT